MASCPPCRRSWTRSIRQLIKGRDVTLKRIAERPPDDPHPHLVLDARYEKVRLEEVVRSRVSMIAIGINWDDRRNVLAVVPAARVDLLAERVPGLKARASGDPEVCLKCWGKRDPKLTDWAEVPTFLKRWPSTLASPASQASEEREYGGIGTSSTRRRLCRLPVRRASDLHPVSFRLPVAEETVAFRLHLPILETQRTFTSK
jgi:hypothetical protein